MSDTTNIRKNGFSAILLAAGSGLRMGGSIKKQFIEVCGHPLIYYPLKELEESPVDEIILVAPEEDLQFVRDNIVNRYKFKKIKSIVGGGSERYLSVYEGLKCVETPWVFVHDGARVFLSQKLIADVMEATVRYKACEIGVPSVDTVKLADEDGYVSMTPPRSLVWSVQTPQGFSTELLKSAYRIVLESKNTDGLTDDAMIIERAFPEQRIKLVMGDYSNIKATTKNDLAAIEKLLTINEK